MSSAISPNATALRRWIDHARERWGEDFARKATGAVCALVLEALLILAVLAIGQMQQAHKVVPIAVTFDAREYSDTPRQPEPKPATKSAQAMPQPRFHS